MTCSPTFSHIPEAIPLLLATVLFLRTLTLVLTREVVSPPGLEPEYSV
jgi:hypothetical protein